MDGSDPLLYYQRALHSVAFLLLNKVLDGLEDALAVQELETIYFQSACHLALRPAVHQW